MNKSIGKKIVLFVSLLLFAISLAGIYTRQTPDESFLKQARGGWQRPCRQSDACGGYEVGPETCPDTVPWCDGSCPWIVPQGEANEYCGKYLPGSCYTNPNAFCSWVITQKCWPGAFDPPHCLCVEDGIGPESHRVDCYY